MRLVGVETGFDEVLVQDLHLAPFVLQNLLDGDPGRWVIVQHLFDEVPELFSHLPALALRELRPEELGALALPKGLVELDCLERILSHDHHEE